MINMKIGLAELIIRKPRFSYSELEQLLNDTLNIEPLGEIYEPKVLKGIPLRNVETYKTLRFEYDYRIESNYKLTFHDDEILLRIFLEGIQPSGCRILRRMYGVDALGLCCKLHKSYQGGGVVEYGNYGSGTFYLINPTPRTIAHEIGHTFGLGHHFPNGTREWDLMHTNEAREFCRINQKLIRKRAKLLARLKRRLLKLTELI